VKKAVSYIDDIILAGETPEKLISTIAAALKQLSKCGK